MTQAVKPVPALLCFGVVLVFYPTGSSDFVLIHTFYFVLAAFTDLWSNIVQLLPFPKYLISSDCISVWLQL
jgi:hypothetical protein